MEIDNSHHPVYWSIIPLNPSLNSPIKWSGPGSAIALKRSRDLRLGPSQKLAHWNKMEQYILLILYQYTHTYNIYINISIYIYTYINNVPTYRGRISVLESNPQCSYAICPALDPDRAEWWTSKGWLHSWKQLN